MNFEPSAEQAMLQEVSRDMLTASCEPALVRSVAEAGSDLDQTLWQRGAELGWTMMAVPEDLDGAGAGLIELAIVAEEIGRAVAPGPWTDTALVAQAVALSGNTGSADLVGALAAGEQKASLALSPGITATASGAGYVLSGVVTPVQAAGSVDWILIAATTDTGRIAALVETSAATTVRRRTLDETRGWYDVRLDQVTVPATHVIATDDLAVQKLVDRAAVLVAADALGVGEKLLRMTVEYTSVREQFGRPIGSFQAVKHKASDMQMTLKGLRAATYYAAMAIDADVPDASFSASIAKAFASERVPELAGEALQVHGGIGFTWEHDLHLYLRRAKVDAFVLGTAGDHHERVAELLTSS